MFPKGSYVLYGGTGVCRVQDIGPLAHIRGTPSDKLYYTLAPLYSSEVIYAPLDTHVFMRPILSKGEATALVDRLASLQEAPYLCEDQRKMGDHYRAVLETHQCEELLRLIKTVYHKNKESTKRGKKPGQIDQRYQKRAEELAYGELAVALGIPYEEVPHYIASRISGQTTSPSP